jgi:hypothetical protein
MAEPVFCGAHELGTHAQIQRQILPDSPIVLRKERISGNKIVVIVRATAAFTKSRLA